SIIKLEEEDLTEQRQLIQLKNLEKLNVNGIIMVAVDAPAVRKCVNSIAEHIPIITYNSDLTDTKRLCFIGQDHIAAGRVSGDLMGMILRRNGKIAILAGSRNMLAHMQRADGFRAALRARGVTGVLPEIYATQESDDKAYEIVTRLIATYDDLVAICVTGGGKVGAGNALSDSGKADNIKLACYDTLPETVQHIKTGVVDYTIAQDPFIQGYMPVKIMYEYLTYGILPKWERILTRIDIRVKDNIENKGYEVFTGKYSNKI
ncbi:MAG: substrate-binding domain-containing protein, partial [Christensenella sp.]